MDLAVIASVAGTVIGYLLGILVFTLLPFIVLALFIRIFYWDKFQNPKDFYRALWKVFAILYIVCLLLTMYGAYMNSVRGY